MLGLFEKQRSMVLKAIQWNKYSSNADELRCPKHHSKNKDIRICIGL